MWHNNVDLEKCLNDKEIDDDKAINDTAEISILMLCDNVLLEVIKHLNLVDSISLSRTCTRLHRLSGMKYRRLDMTKGRWNGLANFHSFSITEVINWVGPHITELDLPNHIDPFIYKIIMQTCKKVDSLSVSYIPYKDAAWNKWIGELNLKRLALSTSENIHEFLNCVTNLEQLKIIDRYPSSDVGTFIQINSHVEKLLIRDDFYGCGNGSLPKLSRLKCLELLNIRATKDLLDLENYVKMDQLGEFTIDIDSECSQFLNLNKFLTVLKEKANLYSLTVIQLKFAINNVLKDINDFCHALTSLNLLSLTLDLPLDLDYFIGKTPAPKLKYLNLKRPRLVMEQIVHIVLNWDELETLCICCPYDLQNETFIKLLYKLSTRRPNLRLYFDNTSNRFLKNVDDKIVGFEICFKESSCRVIRDCLEEQVGLYVHGIKNNFNEKYKH